MSGRDRRLYVYALCDPGLPERLHVRGHSLRVLEISGVGVVAEARSGGVDPTSDAVREQHDIVVSLTDRTPALLPARFGSVVRESELRSRLRDRAAAVRAALGNVRGRRQMTVRVFGKPDGTAETVALPKTGTEFLESRRARIHEGLPDAAVVRRCVGEYVSDERMADAQPGLRVVVYHLVALELVEAYRNRASELQTLLAPSTVRVSGPWPAFAFSPGLL